MLNIKPAIFALAFTTILVSACTLRPAPADRTEAITHPFQHEVAEHDVSTLTVHVNEAGRTPETRQPGTDQQSDRSSEQDQGADDADHNSESPGPANEPSPVDEPLGVLRGQKVLNAPADPGFDARSATPLAVEAVSGHSAGSASYDRSAKGHRLWLDIRFDLDEYDDVIVNYGDGTTQTLKDHLNRKFANVATDGRSTAPVNRWRTDHSYDLALIAVERDVSITWIGPKGVHVETFTARPQAVFDLTYHPLTFTAHASCDWHSPGDFTVTWDQGRGRHTTPKFHLDEGESKTFDEFIFTRPVTIDDVWHEVLRLRFKEHDRLVSRIVAPIIDPTRWKAEFKGVPPGDWSPIVQMLGDHTIPVIASTELGHECYVSATFNASLDLYEG